MSDDEIDAIDEGNRVSFLSDMERDKLQKLNMEASKDTRYQTQVSATHQNDININKSDMSESN